MTMFAGKQLLKHNVYCYLFDVICNLIQVGNICSYQVNIVIFMTIILSFAMTHEIQFSWPRAFRYWCRALFKHDAFHGSKGHKCSSAMRYHSAGYF
jgi:hypothetical protein